MLACHEEFWIAMAMRARGARFCICENRRYRHCRIGRIILKETA